MARSTGPILAVGAITVVNGSVLNGQPLDWRVPVATGVAAGALALAERAWSDGAVAIAYLALATVVLSRVDPRVPSPAESFLAWWKAGER